MKNTTTFLFLGLIVVLLLATCSLDKIDDMTSGNGCPNAPVANFTPDKANCAAPCTVVFTNASTGATTYAWDFGAGGGTSTDAAPSHTFTTAGTYSVRLIATGAGGCKDTAKTDIIIVTPGAMPAAAFTITNNACFAACQMVFTNTSVDATSFSWDFGDGTPLVTQTNPTHTFELPGDYNVKLTATNSGESDTETKPVQVKTITFKKTFEGVDTHKGGSSVKQTLDGGYIIIGTVETVSIITTIKGIYVIKTDNMGVKLWEKEFEGLGVSYGHDVQNTQDGGYIVVGSTSTGIISVSDVYLIKINSNGITAWEKMIGNGVSYEVGYSVQQTQDGGYIVTGDKRDVANGTDVTLIKTNNLGEVTWQKNFGNVGYDYGYSVQQTQDGGYIIVGQIENAPNNDTYLIKVDNSGNEVWSKTYSELYYSNGNSVQQTQDGGYIILGSLWHENESNWDLNLIKTNNAGDVTWKKTFGGATNDEGKSVQQTQDGGYILVGYTTSEGAGDADVYLIKTNNAGELIWKNTYGGALADYGSSVQQTKDGGYIIAGTTYGALGRREVYLIKTDKDGNAQ
jgi:PKD repeat protein